MQKLTYLRENDMTSNNYSPTVRSVYTADPNWFEQYKDPQNPTYDLDGFDAHGYDKNGVDRAGYSRYDYTYEDTNELYFDVCFMFKNYKPKTGGL
jgi:hypothetical protein